MSDIKTILDNLEWYQKKYKCSIWDAYQAYDEPFSEDPSEHEQIDKMVRLAVDGIHKRQTEEVKHG